MLQVIMNGGPVMWCILAAGLAAFLVFLERVFHLRRAQIRPDDFLKGICTNLSHGNVQEAVTLCEETPGPVAYIVKTAILHRESDQEALRAAVDNVGRSEVSRMERRLGIIATAAQLTPLLGLLGTVLSMIGALWSVQKHAPLVQTGDFAVWVMQALVTTAAGLIVAIPCYAGYSFLINKVEKIVLDMERAASEITAFLRGGAPAGGRAP